ncbi:MAG TPA: hypothetical protein VLX91_10845 [Candidatus Acidoferrales bacterium]|nr:hypothetical protein [Candidatus Acidoferrales bacterium]
MKKSIIKNLIILSAVLFAACSKSSSSNPMSSSDTTNVSFASQVQPIFTSNCTNSSCHGGTTPQRGQNLSAGQAYNNIVNVASQEVPSYDRIRPYRSDSSYLYLKITGASGITGARMPYGGSPLQTSDIATIKAWIDQGAKNN